MDARGIILERHRYADTAIAPVTYLQDRMQSLSVSKDILGKEDIQVTMLGSAYEGRSVFLPGDFVVLRTRPNDAQTVAQGSGDAWSWGRVSATRSSLVRAPTGTLTHSPYTVLMQGWYDMLSRTKLHVFEQRGLPSVGTAFNITDWMSIAAQLNSSYGDDAGVIMQFMLKSLLRIRLPESLGGGWLSDEIPVVHNAATARQYAREFIDIESVSFGRLMPSMVQRFQDQRATDVGSLINGMFVPEPMLIEVFPYLSAGGEVQQTTNPPTTGQTPSAPMTPLGKILGRQPVIVYRIKPFRLNPLYTATVAKPVYLDEHVEEGYLYEQQQAFQTGIANYSPDTRDRLNNARKKAREATTKMTFKNPLMTDTLFTQQTFDSAGCVPLDWTHVTQIMRQRADTERINASTIHVVPPTDSAATNVSALDGVGLPITLDKQIEDYGLRLKISNWPFFTPADGGSDDLTIFYRAVAAQVMQFYQNAHLFEYGNITTHFTKALKISEDRTGPTGPRTNAGELMPDIEPGRWFRMSYNMMGGGGEYFGYITSLNHSIQRTTAGNLSAHTVLNFMRGHFAEEWDALHGVVVPITEQDTPQTTAAAGGTSSGTVTGGGSRISAPLVNAVSLDARCSIYSTARTQLLQFSTGVSAVGANPFGAAPTPAQRPLFLKCWLLEALDTDSSTVQRINNALTGTGPEAAYTNNIWALAACCYVIESYWRLKYPNARLRIRSIPRNNDGFHDIFAAVDFYIDPTDPKVAPPTALQLWASLFRLIDAGRIPEGGQGLYLNVNPATGIQGVLPTQAGSPSGNKRYPTGGSSWIHYDIAGSFGGISRPTRSGPFSWLSVDWLGKGQDQLTLIGSSYEQHVAAINKTQDPKKKQQRLDNLETGATPSDLDDVLAGIADPGLIRLARLSRAKPIPKRVTALLYARVQRINSGINDEDTRVPLREAIRTYFTSRGRSDSSLHAVNDRVPNANQVLNGLNWTVQAGTSAPVTPAPTATATPAPPPLVYGKFTAAPTPTAPFVSVYGGTDVSGTPSGVYMYTYMTPKVTTKNNVYVASNHTVPGVKSYDEGFAQLTAAPSARILYMFSGGELPCRKIYEKYGKFAELFDRIYLVDPYFAQSAQFWSDLIKMDPLKFVFVYTPIPQNGPLRRGARTNPENGMTQDQLNLILAHTAIGMTAIEVPLLPPTPTPTREQLLAAHMSTNEKAVEHMVNSRIILV